MEYSIRESLSRMSSDALQRMLNCFLSSKEDIGSDFEIIFQIRRELEKREKQKGATAPRDTSGSAPGWR